MGSKVFPIRASQEQRAVWQAAAERAGLSFNAWAKRALDDQAALDASEAREVKSAGEGGPGSSKDAVSVTVTETAFSVPPRTTGATRNLSPSPSPKRLGRDTVGAMPGMCSHRVSLNAFCGRCP